MEVSGERLALTAWFDRKGDLLHVGWRSGRILPFLFAVTILLAFPSPCVSQQDPGNLDVTLFRRINNGRSEFLSKLVDVNDDLVLPFGIAAPVGFFTYGIFSKNQYETDTGLLVGVSEIVSFGLGQGLKYIVRRDRPYTALANVHVSSAETSDPHSLPSGHATGAFALATSLSLRYPKPAVYIPLHLWALFVAYGRVYLGVHYPSDVLVGGIIGSGTAVVIHLFEEDILGFKKRILGDLGPGGSSLRGLSIAFAPLRGGGVLQVTYRLSAMSP